METKYYVFCSIILIFINNISYGASDDSNEIQYIATKLGENDTVVFTSNKSDAIAWGSFQNEVNKTGWAYLEVETSAANDDMTQAYAAGLVEGRLSAGLLKFSLYNAEEGYCRNDMPDKEMSDFCQKLKTYLNVNLQWMYSQIAKSGGNDTYWHQVSLFLAQLNGIRDGYNNQPSQPSHILEDPLDIFLQVQIEGDVEDLGSALSKEMRQKKILGSGSCSALIKLLPDRSDLYVSHDTWNHFNGMLRILKKHTLNFHKTASKDSPLIPGNVMTFPSNPGSITSGDDFYLIRTGLVTLETTIGNSNADLWRFVQPAGSVLEGIRSMVANRLAATGKEWSDLFIKFNSGTYNNQWMIVDYKQFKPHQRINKPDTLWIVEQIPKYTHCSDQSDLLFKQTYWPSYNLPFYPDIFKESGVADAVAKFGDWFSYEKSPRAQIFKRDQEKVTDIPSMIKLMRYNDFTRDPLSACNCTPPYSGENAISARSDLNPVNGTYPFGALGHRAHGGTDMKVTSYAMFQDLEFVSQLGPAFDNVPAFQWSKSDYDKTLRHAGLPDLYKFQPIQHKWSKN